MKTLNQILITACLALWLTAPTPVLGKEPGSSSRITQNADGTTTEVRWVSGTPGRKASRPSKLYITRDAEGKIISVKRG